MPDLSYSLFQRFELTNGEVTEFYPTRLPPLRSDASTLVLGKFKGGLSLATPSSAGDGQGDRLPRNEKIRIRSWITSSSSHAQPVEERQGSTGTHAGRPAWPLPGMNQMAGPRCWPRPRWPWLRTS